MNKSVAVVIPVYKREISLFETISLKQVDKILAGYDKYFVTPCSLTIDYNIGYEVVKFSNTFFESTATYSSLLMSDEFYACFAQYRYMLIYQLDAFVFEDKLDVFCNSGYDYIGAPINTGDWRKFHVGNGGLSLRKINSVRRVLKEKKRIQERIKIEINPDRLDEDVFFGYCGSASTIDFSVPCSRYAATFSVQNDYVHGMRDIKRNGLPFGCHLWWKENYKFWKPYIESFGYNLPEIETPERLRSDELKRLMYLGRRKIRYLEKRRQFKEIKDALPGENSYSIYGAGIWGRRCLDFLKLLPLRVECVFDKKPMRKEMDGIPIIKAEQAEIALKKSFIVISTITYEREIKDLLISEGLQEWNDFCSIYDLCKKLKDIRIDSGI